MNNAHVCYEPFWRQEVVCGMAIHFQDGGSRSYWTLTALGLIQLKRLLKRKERKKERSLWGDSGKRALRHLCNCQPGYLTFRTVAEWLRSLT